MTEREWDHKLHIRTTGIEEEANAHYARYEATPYAVLERIAQSGFIRRRQKLLDYGCGKGRVPLFLASQVGCRAVGLEQSEKLLEIARSNRRSSRLGDRVTLVHGLAEQYTPTDEDVFFFFNPFSETVFLAVLRRLTQSRQEVPRPMTLLLYYPSEEFLNCLEADPLARKQGEIDCRDLSGGRNPRECVAVYRL